MKKKKVLSLEELIRNLVKQELDNAMGLSDKRRAEFKKQFQKKDKKDKEQVQLKEQQDSTTPAVPQDDISNPLSQNQNSDPNTQPENQGTQTDSSSPNPTDTKSTTPTDPMDDITKTALSVASQTKNPDEVVKAIKSKIQDYGKQVDYVDLMKALDSNNDVNVKRAATKLSLFLGTDNN